MEINKRDYQISLCIPTNGVSEWAFPVLDSIYNQGVSEELFEVIVTDNGKNMIFREEMLQYAENKKNMIYRVTDAPLFLNEIEAYKSAGGKFIKFINHRTILLAGALKQLISFAEENEAEKPIIYFSNGVLGLSPQIKYCETFSDFVENLSYWSSWSTGMGIWKSDFEKLPAGTEFNELFPHTTILFSERNREKYIIDDRVFLEEQRVGKIAKGRYDLFHAFAVEYPAIICDLYRSGDIRKTTFSHVLQENLKLIAFFYHGYVMKGKETSYDLSGFENAMDIFYSRETVLREAEKLIAGKNHNESD